MAGATTGGFGRTIGTILAVLVAAGLGVGGYFAYGWYQKANTVVQDKTIITADSLQKVVEATQRAGDALLAAQADSLSRQIVRARSAATDARAQRDSVVTDLTAQRNRADSLMGAARTATDTAYAQALDRPPSLDSTLKLLALQHARDSSVTAESDTATSVCGRTLRSCALGRARADSIGEFYKTKYDAERKKTRPKWQSITIEVMKDLSIAWITKVIVK